MKAYLFKFEGNTPSKKNNKRILKSKKTGSLFIAGSEDYHNWHKGAALQMMAQARAMGITAPLLSLQEMKLIIFYPDNRRRDNSNIWETVADLMVEAKIIADDCWKVTGTTIQVPTMRPGKPGWNLMVTTA